jgi:hypothetical protein
MFKRKFVRVGALVTTLVAAGALISSVVASSGAYYTAGHSGQISGNNGSVAITVTGSGATATGDGTAVAFDFSGIMPGAPGKTATINVTNTTTNAEDVWLVFDNTNGIWSAVNDLGQYGKFLVGGYVYDNLNNNKANTNTTTPGVAGTPTGSFMSGSCSTVPRVPINYLPRAIKIVGLAGGASASFNMTFMYNACMTDHQGEALFNPAEADAPISSHVGSGGLLFNIVAFQPGVDPTSPFNGANAITQLNLGVFSPFDLQYIQN